MQDQVKIQSQDPESQSTFVKRVLNRREFLKAGGAGLAGAALLGTAGCGSSSSAGSSESSGSSGSKKLTLGYTEWIDVVAITNLAKLLLQDEFDYDIEFQKADLGPIFEGVADGDLDAYLSVWLPRTHGQYMDRVRDEVVDMGKWYGGKANLGLAVPEYMDIQSMTDLPRQVEALGGKIYGIEAGAGIMNSLQEQAIPTYGLEDYKLISASTPAMLAEVENAIDNEEPIVHAAWNPHWMFTAYPIRYLEDPEGTMGTGESISAISRQGLKEGSPVAFALLDELSLPKEQFGELALAIENKGSKTPMKGTRAWLEDHRDVVQPAIDAAKQAQEG